jgi:hypothetical protein
MGQRIADFVNANQISIGTVGTNSTQPVSTGRGTTMQVQKSGIFTATVSLYFSSSIASALCTFLLLSSSIRIPILGNPANAGDSTIGSTQENSDPSSGNFANLVVIGLTPLMIASVYVYVSFYTASGTLTVSNGTLVVIEL